MIYIVHIDAWDSEKKFHELTDEEIVKMYEEDTTFIDCYNDMNELAAAWNSDECFYPNMSYMRVINEPEYVWVFTADQVSDGEALDVITEVFATEDVALKHLHDFVYGDEGELEYAEKRGWTIEYNEPEHYRAFEEGYYTDNHTEATIERREVKH